MSNIEIGSIRQFADRAGVAPLTTAELPRFQAELDTFASDLANQGLSLSAPPFTLPETPEAQDLGDTIAGFYFRMAEVDGPKLSLAWRLVANFANDHPSLHALRQAGERIAADYDRGLHDLTTNTYHNRQHTFETLLNAHILLLLDLRQEAPLSPEERLILLTAALIHDWDHDGSEQNTVYFRQEKRAFDAAKPYLQDISAGQLLRLDLLLRASDLSGPHIYARQALAWQRLVGRLSASDTRPSPPKTPPGMESLSALFLPQQASTAELAAMLHDADLLPLLGLTADYAAAATSRLRDEWARPLGQAEYMSFISAAMSRPRTPRDKRPLLDGEPEDSLILFASQAGQFFNPNIPDVVLGHARLMQEMGEDPNSDEQEPDSGIDFSIFEEAQHDINTLPSASLTSLEHIDGVRKALAAGGFFQMPPFILATPQASGLQLSDLEQRMSLAENASDTLQRLRSVPGPVVSAVIAHLFDMIGLRIDDPVYRAAAAIARQIDEGHGAGTTDDLPTGERNPYHNSNHILDLVLLCDLLGQRASLRKAPASSPLARGLILLAALICHWHHTGKGNKVGDQYIHFYLQDRALAYAEPYLDGMSKELRQSLIILVRSTDAREPYSFCRAAYAYHVGLGPRPDVAAHCDSLSRVLGDPALCTLVARLNDAVFVPFVGLSAAYSARSMVQLGREIGTPIDFGFVRKFLITPMLSRPVYRGETPPTALIVGKDRVASFTSAEAQALFNPTMHALMLADYTQRI